MFLNTPTISGQPPTRYDVRYNPQRWILGECYEAKSQLALSSYITYIVVPIARRISGPCQLRLLSFVDGYFKPCTREVGGQERTYCVTLIFIVIQVYRVHGKMENLVPFRAQIETILITLRKFSEETDGGLKGR